MAVSDFHINKLDVSVAHAKALEYLEKAESSESSMSPDVSAQIANAYLQIYAMGISAEMIDELYDKLDEISSRLSALESISESMLNAESSLRAIESASF